MLGLLIVVVFGAEVVAWSDRNGIPDGYQNEFLHIGNALDLWRALVERDSWHLQYHLTTNYWPPGFYVAPWPLFALFGATHRAMVLTNLVHLAVLLAGTYLLGREVRDARTGLVAMGLVALYPSIYGNLVRFEPNVAVAAWVTVGAWLLVRSRGFADRRVAAWFGVACAVGLLMDRVSLGVFLALPAAASWIGGMAQGEARRRLIGGLVALAVLAAVAGWWHVEFVQRHLEELVSQGGVGEIDSAGEWTEQREAWSVASFVFYLTALVDSQAGPVLGFVGLAALVAAPWKATRERMVPLLVVLASVGLFTLVQKKQAYYTIPMLGCVAVLSADLLARLRRLRWPLVVGLVLAGLGVHSERMWDRATPLPRVAVDLRLPELYTFPRFPQALPPRGLRLPVDTLAAALPPGEVVVFSEDSTWFEGYVVLQLRERRPDVTVRGLTSDPQGVYEWFDTSAAFVHVSTDVRGDAFPTTERMEASLSSHHVDLDALPPVLETLEEQSEAFDEVAWWPLEHGGRVTLLRRTRRAPL
ncbi:MAG: hypothetical protein GY884_00995 [Proteobacteria bacterium]|nr:hypothetical protein [Pseudomonadota bacterium]